jgi:polar amino acid transport system permease protein
MPLATIHFDWPFFLQRLFHPDPVFWGALATTVCVAVVAQLIGVVLGLFSALAGLSRIRPLNLLSYAYVLAFRGTPLVVQIFFVYYGVNLFLGFDLFPRTLSLVAFAVSGAVLAGITALSFNEGAYMSEIFRAAIGAIDPGQLEAAKSVGMTRALAMRRIILPQAARIVVPPLGNEFNGMLKNTSLLAFIGVYEMFQDAEVTYSNTFKPAEVFLAVACWYLLLTVIWSAIQAQIERKLGASEREEREGWLTRLVGVRPRWDGRVPGRPGAR